MFAEKKLPTHLSEYDSSTNDVKSSRIRQDEKAVCVDYQLFSNTPLTGYHWS